MNSEGLYLATKETITIYGQHNTSATNVLSVTDNRKMHNFLNKCSPCVSFLVGQTPSITVLCAYLISFFQSWLSLIKPWSPHVLKHSVSQAFPGVQTFEMASKETCHNHCNYSAAAAAAAVTSSPWGNQFKTNYERAVLSSHSSHSFFSSVTGNDDLSYFCIPMSRHKVWAADSAPFLETWLPTLVLSSLMRKQGWELLH